MNSLCVVLPYPLELDRGSLIPNGRPSDKVPVIQFVPVIATAVFMIACGVDCFAVIDPAYHFKILSRAGADIGVRGRIVVNCSSGSAGYVLSFLPITLTMQATMTPTSITIQLRSQPPRKPQTTVIIIATRTMISAILVEFIRVPPLFLSLESFCLYAEKSLCLNAIYIIKPQNDTNHA